VLYRSHVGILPCNGYTLHFKLQSQATLLLDAGGKHPGNHCTTLGVQDSIPLW